MPHNAQVRLCHHNIQFSVDDCGGTGLESGNQLLRKLKTSFASTHEFPNHW